MPIVHQGIAGLTGESETVHEMTRWVGSWGPRPLFYTKPAMSHRYIDPVRAVPQLKRTHLLRNVRVKHPWSPYTASQGWRAHQGGCNRGNFSASESDLALPARLTRRPGSRRAAHLFSIVFVSSIPDFIAKAKKEGRRSASSGVMPKDC